MPLTKHILGEFFELYNENCNNPNLTIFDVSGVNSDKEFFEPSKQVGQDTSKYKVVPYGYFACNLMHVGRDKVLPIAMNHSGKSKIVSPAYTVFEFKGTGILLPEYFFMLLKSPEKDRYFWFHTDSSVRDGMSWEDFCSLEIMIPDVSVQQKYVDIYNAILENQRSYERGLENLRKAVFAKIDMIKHSARKVPVGELLEEIDLRNIDGSITNIQGINIEKQFMPSVADTASVNIKNYKVVHEGQFAYSSMQTGRDKCIRIALYDKDNPILISPAYSVLRLKEPSAVAEYIMLWFTRPETDRYGWFASDASIRANLDLDRFYEIEIPMPDTAKQHSIANIYIAYMLRREINEQLKTQIRDICPILIKGSLEESMKAGIING